MSRHAVHITWGTHGMRLHGDPRKTVDHKHNELDTPFLGLDLKRWERSKEKLKYPPVVFTREQTLFVERAIPPSASAGTGSSLLVPALRTTSTS